MLLVVAGLLCCIARLTMYHFNPVTEHIILKLLLCRNEIGTLQGSCGLLHRGYVINAFGATPGACCKALLQYNNAPLQ
ncbi:hypothetical protein A4R26_30070 [Niastella populi]|uniref:Uncharacterized protein n=1 Tax=Niastella populi TaxID=550983 RepID=A0A1V9EVR5_9BACT|nr:hypothetical protein A4R26_30070 [Niastella populi]